LEGYIVVVGLQRSGVAAANLLIKEGRQVVVTDTKTADLLGQSLKGLDPSVRLALGGHPEGLLEGAGLVVLSPGVPSDIKPVKLALEAGVEVIGELELSWRAFSETPFYAVTGTNGKSTVVSLLALMMERSGIKCLLGGNIGKPLTFDAAAGESAERIVAEVSSFQLENISRFHAQGAAILNVTPDHLDRYPSMDAYTKVKADITLNQSAGDVLVLNADDPGCMGLKDKYINEIHGRKILYFSRKGEVEGVFLKHDMVIAKGSGDMDGELFSTKAMRMKGVHNLENAMAAALLAIRAGCKRHAIIEAIMEFTGLPHRLEHVREFQGVTYINDSKGTNVDAVVKSLEGFKDNSVVLIAGGRDKDSDFTPLKKQIEVKCRALVLIGEAADKIEAKAPASLNCKRATDMMDAVQKAAELAQSGDTVLLSPACASFDMFRDFEERGEFFREAVKAL
jgi:UDP-N-acetylmuramoylalanine--D-glutamate ligase